ncbi:MAG: glycosyltransferase family 2 protein [Selenomonas sp.]|uniref:glycosyltransferase family 2 protein n=1 Tax=Selenomonas sp. TaxID=2053611 RepID=UPI0025CE04B1|nr:glycosyltransferase family 2 protein [Selenomonas sp.]MCR5757368.1 glycosyltransferase family 2 protein [Selenomonas sp.]
MDKITIVVPCYNEQEVVEKFYTEVSRVLQNIADCTFTYLFVNDGSRDNTLSLLQALSAREKNVNYLSLSRNFGKEAAMMAGLDYADGDAVIIMDADLQHPPELVPEMIDWWRQGYDDVCAKRTDRTDETWFKRHMANLFYRCLQTVSRFRVQRDVGDFRLLDKRCVAALRLMRENQRFTKGMFTWVGYRKKEIPFHVRPRAAGTTTWSYLALYNLAVEGMTSFTTAPLRMTTILGLGVSGLAMFYMCWVLFNALCYGDPVAGYPTLMTVMLFLGGIQLLSLGIIGEYLGRVFQESKGRPIYLVDEHNGKKMIYGGRDEWLPHERD